MKSKLAIMAAAMFAATGAASAADLGRPAPAAVDYVKVCDAYGAGFFYIPGSQTCLKIGGFVRAEYRAYNFDNLFAASAGKTVGTNDPSFHDMTTRVRTQLTFDARTNTEFGLLRSFIESWLTFDSTSSSPSVTLWNAYIQFGGLTAGRAQSFFDFYTGTTYGSYFEAAHSDAHVNLLAYTFSFGNGVSATLSLEDPTTGSNNRRPDGMFFIPTSSNPVLRDNYGGLKLPDVVGNVRIAQAWGSAQVMAVAHQNTSAFSNDTAWGYAVGGGLTVNLPMIAAGDTINLQAAYSKGAIAYTGADLSIGAFDFIRNGNNNLVQSKSWSVAGGFNHFWTSKLSTAVNASYLKVDNAFNAFNYKQMDAQANVVYAIVPGLNIGAELEYRKIDFANGPNTDALVGLLRFQRNF